MIYEISVGTERCYTWCLNQFLPSGLLIETNQVRGIHVVQNRVEGRPQIPLTIPPLVGYIQQPATGSPTYQRHYEGT